MEGSPLLAAAAPASSRRSAFAGNAFAALGSTIVVGLALAGYYEHTGGRGAVPAIVTPPLAETVAHPFNKNNTPVQLHVEVVRNASAKMRLHVVLRVALSGGAVMTRLSDDDETAAMGQSHRGLSYVVSSAYGPSDGSAVSPLRAATVTLDAANGWSAELPLFRLRPSKTYDLEVNATAAGTGVALRATTTFDSFSTGIPRFDLGPLATITGDTPSWEMLSFTYQVATQNNPEQYWQGLVAIDREGYVVWYWANDEMMAWDFLPEKEGNGVVVLCIGDGSSNVGLGPKIWKEDGKPYYPNSRLTQITPDGEVVKQYIQGCTGSPQNYNAFSHELRIDPSVPNAPVLTTETVVEDYPDVTIKSPGHHDDDDTSYHCNMFVGATISMWHRQENKVETLYNLFEWIMPSKYAPGVASNIAVWNDQSDMYCAGDLTTNAGSDASWLDYHHVSSVSTGPDGDFIVSLRNLDTIIALYANGTGPMWVLSSAFSKEELKETFPKTATIFNFKRNADRFYSAHGVMQLANGDVMLIDDGNSRQGCTSRNNYMGCFSRALIYKLNFTEHTVDVAWQFEDPYGLEALKRYGEGEGLDADRAGEEGWTQTMTHDQFNFDGGSVYRLASGHNLVAFTSLFNNRAYNQNYSMYAWEADGTTAEARSTIIVPHGTDAMKTSGGYRMTPWNSIHGERSMLDTLDSN